MPNEPLRSLLKCSRKVRRSEKCRKVKFRAGIHNMLEGEMEGLVVLLGLSHVGTG